MVMKNSDKSKGNKTESYAEFYERLKEIKDPKLRKVLEDQIVSSAESLARIENNSRDSQKKTDEDLNRIDQQAAGRKKKHEEEMIEIEAGLQEKREESARLAAEFKEQERRKTEQFNKEFEQRKEDNEQQILEKGRQLETESAQIYAEIKQRSEERTKRIEEETASAPVQPATEHEYIPKTDKEMRREEEALNKEIRELVKIPGMPEIDSAYSLRYDRKGPGFIAAVKERIVPIGVAACIMLSAANFTYRKVPAVKTFVDSTISSVKHTGAAKTQLPTKVLEEKTHEAKANKPQATSFIKDYRAHLQEFVNSVPGRISKAIHREKSDRFEIITRRSYPQDAVSKETVKRIVEGIYRETGKKVKVYTNINLGIGSLIIWNGETPEAKWIGEIGCGAPTPDTLSPIGISKLVEKLANKPFVVIPACVRDFAGFKGIDGFHIDEKGRSAWAEYDSAANLLGPAKGRLNSKDGFYMLTLGRSCCAPWLASARTLDAGAERGLTRGAKESTTLGCIYIAYYKTYIYTGNSDDFLKGKFKQQITDGKFREAREGEEIPLKDGSAGSLRKVASGMPGELRIYDKNGNPVDFTSVDWSKAPKLTYLPIDPEESEFFKSLKAGKDGDWIFVDDRIVIKNEKGFIILAGRYDSVNGISEEESVKRAIKELEALGIRVSIQKVREAINRANKNKTGYWITEIS